MFSTYQKNRYRRLMNLMEQKSTTDYVQEFQSSNYQNLRELLETNQELLNKLKEYTDLESVDDIESFLTRPNKTKLMMIMFEAVDVLETQDEMTKFMQFVKRIDSNEVQTIFFTMAMRTQRTVRLARNNTEIAKWCQENHQYM